MEDILFVLLKNIFLFLQIFFKKDTYIFVDNLYERHTSCIDTYTIFEHVKENLPQVNAYYLLWKQNLCYKKINKHNVIVVEKQGFPDGSNFYFLCKTFVQLLRCSYFVSSFYGSLPTKYREFIKENKKIKLVGIGHGPVCLKTLVFDYSFCQDKEWDKYLVSSDFEKDLFKSHGWNENKIIKCSLPRFDKLCNKQSETRKIFIMFTWRLTFEKIPNSIFKSKYLKELLHFLKKSSLIQLCKKHNIELVLGIHHAMIDIVHFDYRQLGLNIRLADTTNLLDEINTSDLCITDYSSIFWDFAYLNKPCIFYPLDYDDQNLIDIDKKDIKNSIQNYKNVYNVFFDVDSVIKKIEYYTNRDFVLEDDFVEKMNQYFYTRENNTSAFLNFLNKD